MTAMFEECGTDGIARARIRLYLITITSVDRNQSALSESAGALRTMKFPLVTSAEKRPTFSRAKAAGRGSAKSVSPEGPSTVETARALRPCSSVTRVGTGRTHRRAKAVG